MFGVPQSTLWRKQPRPSSCHALLLCAPRGQGCCAPRLAAGCRGQHGRHAGVLVLRGAGLGRGRGRGRDSVHTVRLCVHSACHCEQGGVHRDGGGLQVRRRFGRPPFGGVKRRHSNAPPPRLPAAPLWGPSCLPLLPGHTAPPLRGLASPASPVTCVAAAWRSCARAHWPRPPQIAIDKGQRVVQRIAASLTLSSVRVRWQGGRSAGRTAGGALAALPRRCQPRVRGGD